MKLLLLPALVAASGLPVRRPLFASLPSHKPESPSWLLAATGRCTHQLYTELDEPGYKAHVEFEFLPSTTIQFTDAPNRQAFEIITPNDQINELADESWSYKNVALLEPNAEGTDWAISTFEIEEHGISEDGDAVHYSGRVTTRSSNFPGVRNDTFPCQLFVDSNPGKCKMTCVLPARASAWGGGRTFRVKPSQLVALFKRERPCFSSHIVVHPLAGFPGTYKLLIMMVITSTCTRTWVKKSSTL